MSSIQAGGGKSSNQPGGGRTGAPTSARPGGRTAQAKPQSTRPAGGKAGAARQGTAIDAKAPRRFSPAALGFAAVVVVVVVVVALVVVKITTKSNNSSSSTGRSLASAAVVAAVTEVPQSVNEQVGLPSIVSSVPTSISGQPPLTVSGKPAVIFVGSEYCPYCAAERWSIVNAFSKFGTFSHLSETASSSTDVFPDTFTFSFHGSSFNSQYFTFLPTELYTNQQLSSGNGYQTLDKLNSFEAHAFAKYDAPPYTQQAGGFPFLDFGNKVLVTSVGFSPQVLQGLDDSTISKDLSDPNSQVAQAILGYSNYLQAAICTVAGNQPASVCSSPAVVKALGSFKAY